MDTITLSLFIAGFILLITGAELLVRGASRLAVTAGISPLVVGLTVVAFGTSAPELAVTIQSTLAGQADIAVGNVVGSNISNILLVLGVAAMVAPLVVAQQLIRLDVPLMIGLSLLVMLLGFDGTIGLLDGLFLSTSAVAYTVFAIRQSRRESKRVETEYEQEFDGPQAIVSGPLQMGLQVGYIVIGLLMLVLGSRWLINGAVVVAVLLGVGELIIGLTIVAVGTSLPEIATSIIAAFRGERDIAVGNAVGSNLFNIMLVLGLGAVVSPGGIKISGAALYFDIPVMAAVALACLPIFFSGYRIDRWEGFVFVGYYIAYTVYLFLAATQHNALNTFNSIMAIFVLPLTIITLVVIFVRTSQAERRSRRAAPVASQEADQLQRN